MKGGTPKSRMLWTFVVTSLALVMVTLDNLVVTTAIPVIRKDLDASHRGARVDGQRVHAHLRRAAPDRRRARRPLRAPAHVRDRARHLHARLGGGRARAVDRGARRRPRDPGRSAARSSLPLTLTILSAAVPAEKRGARARRLGRDRRPRRRARPARRRRGRRGPLLALDLLDQRPDRPRADPARAPPARRDVRPEGEARPAGPRPRQRRPVRHRLGPRPRQRPGLDEHRDRRLARDRRRAWSSVFVLWELRAEAPMLPMRFFRNRTFALTNVASLLMFFGMFGSIFLLAQFFQTVQGYSPLRLGAAHPAVDGDADLRRPDRGRAVRPDRRPAADGRPGSRCRRSGSAGSRRSATPTAPYCELVAPFILSGVGMALFFAPVANVVLSSVRPEEEGKASGANNAIRELGGVFGVAVLASIFAHYGGYGTGADVRRRARRRRSGSARSSSGSARWPRFAIPRRSGRGQPSRRWTRLEAA